MYRLFIFLFIFLCIIPFHGKSTNTPFSKGVNLTGWFQVGSAQEIQFSKYSRTDFENIQSLGCDVVRLPINLHFMTNGEPNYTLDPLFLQFIDQVISWTEELGMHLILDNHTFDSAVDTDPNVGEILKKVWLQMASHYLNSSTQIYFEVLNEPHGINDELWNTIQKEVIDAIRTVDTKHTIIVGPASWNSYNNLEKMPVYSDDNLIYTFHFYDPFIFTHQGASWTDMDALAGVPFPYAEDKMPEFPEELKSHWSYNDFKDYKNTGTIEAVHNLIDIAVKFQEERNVPLFCGEFGVYDKNSPNEDRTYWYGVVSDYLEEKNIAWTVWDYHGAFGIYTKGSNGMFNHDLNVPVCEALGLTPPEQTVYVALPDSVGFEIFSDVAGKNINNAINTDGEINFFSTFQPNNGAYCIEWSEAAKYNALSFNFSPIKDLSRLVDEGYALDFFIKSTDINGSLDFRFIDSDTGDDDHPWRRKVEVNNTVVAWTGIWEHVHIPLANFQEQGAWENDNWYNPEGLFDWTAIDKLEIVAETQEMGNHTFWIDNIYITNQDTAQVRDYTAIENYDNNENEFVSITSQNNGSHVSLKNNTNHKVQYQFISASGQVIERGNFIDSKTLNTNGIKKGLYLIWLKNSQNKSITKKIIIH
ncbi:MAG: cellulase family glycosylhydrolase [Prolixibacteraceae bacterium]|nr:cellulase family glycosylhydrolase [Prolixibacteraceae bacterium]